MKKVNYDDRRYCPVCGEINTVIAKDTIKLNVCEAETICSDCGHEDYWAYGWYQSKENQNGSV